MILTQATIKYKGYDPITLSKGSHKRVCVSCDMCGRVRWVRFQKYRDLCISCSNSIKNIGILKSNETKEKISKSHLGKKLSNEHKKSISKHNKGKNNPNYGNGDKIRGELNPAWKGGIAGVRTHVLPINKCLHINQRFDNSHAHHISSDVVVFIPRDLHYHIKHSLKDNYGMYEMNLLSLQYLKGWL